MAVCPVLGNLSTVHACTQWFALLSRCSLALPKSPFACPAGMPISSTHCQIGSIVAVGVMEGGFRSVQGKVLGKIVSSWVVTVPAAALTAAALLAALRFTLP